MADYFVKLNGTWLPVEAKLNVASERNIKSQIQKYIHVNSITPTKGHHRGETIKVSKVPICIVIDQQGIYPTKNGEFVDCEPGNPKWKRLELSHTNLHDIRDYFQVL